MHFYGGLTNPYLLINYGFCYRDNKFDQFDVWLDKHPDIISPSYFVCNDWQLLYGSQVAHLKANVLSHLTMYYLRICVQTEIMIHGKTKSDEDSDMTLTSVAAIGDLIPNTTLNETKVTNLD